MPPTHHNAPLIAPTHSLPEQRQPADNLGTLELAASFSPQTHEEADDLKLVLRSKMPELYIERFPQGFSEGVERRIAEYKKTSASAGMIFASYLDLPGSDDGAGAYKLRPDAYFSADSPLLQQLASLEVAKNAAYTQPSEDKPVKTHAQVVRELRTLFNQSTDEARLAQLNLVVGAYQSSVSREKFWDQISQQFFPTPKVLSQDVVRLAVRSQSEA